MRAVIALAVIALVTGVFGMSQISPVMSKTKLMKTRLVNQMVDIELLRERIKDNEGYDLIPKYLEYDDANGKHIIETWLTGGYGTKLSKNHKEPEGGYTEAYWNERFEERFDEAHNGALKLLGKDTDYRAIGVITEMIYQMGYDGVKKFKKTLEYMNNAKNASPNITKQQWTLASEEMLDSDWAIQTKNRADRLSKIIANIR